MRNIKCITLSSISDNINMILKLLSILLVESKSSLKVSHGTTVNGIKGLVQQTTEIQPAELMVFHNDQELESGLTLSDCRIHSGSTLIFRHAIKLFISCGAGKLCFS